MFAIAVFGGVFHELDDKGKAKGCIKSRKKSLFLKKIFNYKELAPQRAEIAMIYRHRNGNVVEKISQIQKKG